MTAPAADPSGGLVVRRATAADVAAYTAFGRRVSTDSFGAQNDPAQFAAYLAQTFGEAQQRAEIEHPGGAVLLAEAGGALAGYAYLRHSPAPPGVAGPAPLEIARFYVDAEWHGRGVARALMGAAATEAERRAAHTLWLGTWERNARAIAFYAKCGFADVGAHVFMLGSEAQRDRLMAAPTDVVAASVARLSRQDAGTMSSDSSPTRRPSPPAAPPMNAGVATTMRAWRRAYRRARWSACRTRADRVRLLKTALAHPLRAALDARQALRSPAAAAARARGVSLARQFAQLWWLRAVHGIECHTYYHQQLFLPERWPRARGVVRERELRVIMRALHTRHPSPDRRVFSDKRRFEEWCRTHGFPAASSLVEIEAGAVVRGDALTLPPLDLFSKLVNSFGGRGARRWRWVGTGYATANGSPVDAAGLIAELVAQSTASGRPVVVQRAIDTHGAVRDLTTGALATMRLITACGADEIVRPLLALYKMPRGAAMIDAFGGGGLAAAIDLTTGALGPAVRKSTVATGETYDVHPDTGGRISGRVLPCWQEATALTVAAHQRARGPLPVIGWDVALTASGPVLIEGNIPPSVSLSQIPSGTPLGETMLVPLLLQLLGARAAAGASHRPA